MTDDRPAVVILNWRDTGHPEGGGSELYVEELAAGLARRGHRVTLVCARYPGASVRERTADGVEIVRVGGRLSVYPRSALAYVTGRLGRPAVLIEVQNGMPFLARLWARRPRVIVLVHHVHREQWRVVLPAPAARVGWWIESRLAPLVNRRTQYVAVSDTTRQELIRLGVAAEHIAVVRNGTPAPDGVPVARAATPTLVVVSRLVPHKRIGIAIDTLAALLPQFPELRLVIVGRGWWEQPLRRHVDLRGVGDHVEFTGYVDDLEKTRRYGQAWVSLVPSVKEGWGLVVVEAGAAGTPSVAFRDAGGVSESIRDGFTGLLADDPTDFAARVETLLQDEPLRRRLGAQAAEHARSFTWGATVQGFAALIESHQMSGRDGSGLLRPVVDQRSLDLLGSRLRRGVDADARQPGQHGRDDRRQRDAHELPPMRSLHGGRYRRSRTTTPAQSPALSPAATTPAAVNSASAAMSATTTGPAGGANPRAGSPAPRTHRFGTSYRLRSGPR
ncbi:MAG TPA: glycosyltransferase family 4 protein [Jatrophihabitans sp.]|jgi:glycosyltransferase involved in cell wall biosynthesis